MTIKVTFEFQTVEEAAVFINRNSRTGTPPVPVERPRRTRAPRPEMVAENGAPEPVVVEAAPQIATAPVAGEAQRITAKASAEPGAVAPASVKAAPKEPNAPVKAVVDANLDAVRGALRDVFNTKGAPAATELLKQFGAARVGEVKPADYAAFIAACGK